MPQWQRSTRRDRLPPDWVHIRKRVLRRDDHSCQWKLDDGRQCLREAHEVDHIRRGDDHREANLRALCSWHHAKKSSQEGGQANAAVKREINNRFRRHESHPGLM